MTRPSSDGSSGRLVSNEEGDSHERQQCLSVAGGPVRKHGTPKLTAGAAAGNATRLGSNQRALACAHNRLDSATAEADTGRGGRKRYGCSPCQPR